jgi:hypothetical protein
MALLVRYKNNDLGYVPKYDLNDLISNGAIDSFMRSSGQWVKPDKDPIRKGGSTSSYNGPERRARF